MSGRVALGAWLVLASLPACGATPPVESTPVNEEKLARRIADEMFERLRRQGYLECLTREASPGEQD